MRTKRLLPRYREQIAVMADLAKEMERQLDSKAYDHAEPSLEPGLDQARKLAGHLAHWLDELRFLVEREHSERRPRVMRA